MAPSGKEHHHHHKSSNKDAAAEEGHHHHAHLSHHKKLLGMVEIHPLVISAATTMIKVILLAYALYNAYRIRTYSLTEFGMVIHEFDPWFNYRAAEYLKQHGWHAFFHWFDYMSWYPLGRPVGTTIYPGLQITAVYLQQALQYFGISMSLLEICCTIPCWFGSVATAFLALLTYEATQQSGAAVMSALIMAIIPAHMMRSVGGGFDNECIAITAIVATFYFWVRSLRNSHSWGWGVLCGLAYGYMVAAWGGFIFVLNMVAFHAACTVIIDTFANRYQRRLHLSYSLFYIIGTAIATRVPPVGMMPFKSLEQLFALVVFVGLQVLAVAEHIRRGKKHVEINSMENFRIRLRCLGVALAIGTFIATIIVPEGFFGPLSSRVRGLFVQHTRTGNPLVDSVAEHQPASPDAYWQYLHFASYGWQIGMFVMPFVLRHRHNAAMFLSLYGFVSYYFSLKMARLIILAGPIASVMTGYVLAAMISWTTDQLMWSDKERAEEKDAERQIAERVGDKRKNKDSHKVDNFGQNFQLNYKASRNTRIVIAAIFALSIVTNLHWGAFNAHAERLAMSFANPQIMFKSQQPDGRVIMIDDYRDGYHWLRDNTPEDARVLSWWDYGYQITGIGNRTTLADGNTWNHEHIATIGYMLTSPIKRAHGLIRHVADYVLVWAGTGGDDLAKSPHMARIGNSVYRDVCPKDPLCMDFGFHGQDYGKPTPMMKNSLLYNLVSHNQRPGIRVDSKYFTEAYTSKHGLLRIFKVTDIDPKSKAWLADPKNRECDAPGSWYCTGKYPPVKEWDVLLAKRNDFGQLEDFNRKRDEASDDYHKSYMSRMTGR